MEPFGQPDGSGILGEYLGAVRFRNRETMRCLDAPRNNNNNNGSDVIARRLEQGACTGPIETYDAIAQYTESHFRFKPEVGEWPMRRGLLIIGEDIGRNRPYVEREMFVLPHHCSALCRDHIEGCVAFTWTADGNGTCWWKRSVEEIRAVDAAWSAVSPNASADVRMRFVNFSRRRRSAVLDSNVIGIRQRRFGEQCRVRGTLWTLFFPFSGYS